MVVDISVEMYKTCYYGSLGKSLYWFCVAGDNFMTPEEVSGNQYWALWILSSPFPSPFPLLSKKCPNCDIPVPAQGGERLYKGM